MAFVDGFLIPLIKAIGIVGILGFLTIVIIRAILIKWNRQWKFVVKYDLLKSKVDPVKAGWCWEALQKGLSYEKIKMMLLLRGFRDEDVWDLLFLCNRFSKQLKGGLNNGRQFKRSDPKVEGAELPTISSY
jgi:hypothetical protein